MTLLRTLRPTMTGFLLAAVAGLTLFGAAPARAQAINQSNLEGRLDKIRQGQRNARIAVEVLIAKYRLNPPDYPDVGPGGEKTKWKNSKGKEFEAPDSGLTGPKKHGGFLPASLGVARTDDFEAPLGYCARGKNGIDAKSPIIYAVIWPGLDGVFQTRCADVLQPVGHTRPAGLRESGANGDDYVAFASLNYILGNAVTRVESVPTTAALLALDTDEVAVGELRYVDFNSRLWRWNGSEWKDASGFADTDGDGTPDTLTVKRLTTDELRINGLNGPLRATGGEVGTFAITPDATDTLVVTNGDGAAPGNVGVGLKPVSVPAPNKTGSVIPVPIVDAYGRVTGFDDINLQAAVSGFSWALAGNINTITGGGIGETPLEGSNYIGTNDAKDFRLVTNGKVRAVLGAGGELTTGDLNVGGSLNTAGSATVGNSVLGGGALNIIGGPSTGTTKLLRVQNFVVGVLTDQVTIASNGTVMLKSVGGTAGTSLAAVDRVIMSDADGTLTQVSTQTLVGETAWSITGNTGINPSVNFIGTRDTNDVAFRTANTERLRILGSGANAGYVGIGTTAPVARLDVNGTFRATGDATFGGSVTVANLLAANGGVSTPSVSTTGTLALAANGASGTLTASTAGTERLRITNAGDIGIGTSSPEARLDVNGSLRARGNTILDGSLTVGGATVLNGTLGVAKPATFADAVTVAGLLRANGGIDTTVLNTSGNATIGGNLGVTGTTTLTGALTANGGITTNTLAATTSVTTPLLTNAGTLTLAATGTAPTIIASTAGIERLRVTAGGRVGINTLSDASTGAALQVNTGADGTVGLLVRGNSATQTADLLQVVRGNGSTVLSVDERGSLTLLPYGTAAGTTNELRFATLAAGQYVGFRAPNAAASNLIWTLPSADGAGGNVLATNGDGVLSWINPLTAASGWTVIGNASTNSGGALGAVPTDGSNFLGTLDNTDLRVVTGNRVRAIFTAGGQFQTNDVAIGGGSINGTAIGNVNPSTGAFTTVDATTSVTTPLLQGSGLQVSASAGDLSLRAIGNVIGYAGGSERFRIVGSGVNAGNVGIGNNAPTNRLDVTGTFRATGATTIGGALTASSGITTTTLNASGAVTLGGGTANGVAYLNGSKVLTTGTALTFDGTNLATTGTATATKLIPTGGTAAGNGMYLPATNTLAFSTNGAERLRIDATGQVGIGMTPGRTLDVTGTFGVSGASTFTGAATLGSTLTVGAATTLNGATQVNNTLLVTNLLTANGGVSATTVATSGAATIGNTLTVTNGPTTLSGTLAVGGATTLTALGGAVNNTIGTLDRVVMTDSSGVLSQVSTQALVGATAWAVVGNSGTNPTNNFLGTTDTADLAIRTNNAERVRVLGSGANAGFVGIGVAAPTALLDVNGAFRARGASTLNGSLGVDGASTFTGLLTANGGISTTTLSASGAVTLGGGTANGVAYLNGSKVLTTGTALTFDGTNLATTGTATATKLIPTGGTAVGNGMYLPLANTLAFSTNGAERLRIDATGQVGIGMTPGRTLDVTGTFGVTGASTLTGAATLGSTLSVTGTTTLSALGGVVNTSLTGLDRVVMTGSTGKLSQLSTSSFIGATAWALVGNAGTNAASNFLGTTDAVDLAIRTNNAERVRVLGSGANAGFVGIGVAAPTALLDVNGAFRARGASTLNGSLGVDGASTFTGLLTANGGITTNTLAATTSVTTPLVTNAGTLALSATGANIITASTNGAERLRIDANGQVGIGMTPGRTLDVTGTFGVSGATTLAGATQVNNTLGVTGATTLSNTLTVSGASQINNTLGVTGATMLTNTLTVSGASQVNNTLGVTGVLTASAGVRTPSVTNPSGALSLTATGGTLGLAATGANPITLATNGVERLRVDSVGRVGIGTNNPTAAQLMIVSSDAQRIGLLLRGALGQESNFFEVQANDGTPLFSVNAFDTLGAPNPRAVVSSAFLASGTVTLSSIAGATPGSTMGSNDRIVVADPNGTLSQVSPGAFVSIYAWGLKGNTGSTSSGVLGGAPAPGSNFIGTLDNTDIRFVANNKVRGILRSDNGRLEVDSLRAGEVSSSGNLVLRAASTIEGLRVASNGLVGVGGVAIPDAQLQIRTVLGTTPGLLLNGADDQTANLLDAQVGGVSRFVVSATGALSAGSLQVADVGAGSPNNLTPAGYDRVVIANGSGQFSQIAFSQLSNENTWLLAGNAGVNSTGNIGSPAGGSFLGTTDTRSLRLATNGTVRAILDGTTGTFSIGSVAVSGGSLNGVTIGASSPGAGSFTSLNASTVAASSSVTTPSVSSTSGLSLATTGAGAGGISLSAGGINAITFATNGAERLRITDEGKVGIGTSAPGAMLQVTNTVAAGNKGLVVNGVAGQTANLIEAQVGGAANFVVSAAGGVSAQSLRVVNVGAGSPALSTPGGYDRVVIANGSGDFSQIAFSQLSNENTWLIDGNTGGTSGGALGNTPSVGSRVLGTRDDVDLRLIANNKVRAILTSAGQFQTNDVAIGGGTINGTAIGNTARSSGAFTTLAASSTITAGTTITAGATVFGNTSVVTPLLANDGDLAVRANDGALTIGTFGLFPGSITMSAAGDNPISIRTDNKERVRILGALGRVGIGTTTDPVARLQVNTPIDSEAGLIVGGTALATGDIITARAGTTDVFRVRRTQTIINTALNVNGSVSGDSLTVAGATTLTTLGGAAGAVSGDRVVVADATGQLAQVGRAALITAEAWGLTGNGGTSSANYLGTSDDADLRFGTNGTVRATITKTGQFQSASVALTGGSINGVTIGGSVPAAGSFTSATAGTMVASTSLSTPSVFNNNSALSLATTGFTGGNISLSAAGGGSNIIFSTDDIERMRIRPDGAVGIGVVVPGATLDVNGTFRAASWGSVGGVFGVGGDTTLASKLVVNGATRLGTLGGGVNNAVPSGFDRVVLADSAGNLSQFDLSRFKLTDSGGGGGGAGSVAVQDEGASLTLTADRFNFVGDGVTATLEGPDKVRIFIPGVSASLPDDPVFNSVRAITSMTTPRLNGSGGGLLLSSGTNVQINSTGVGIGTTSPGASLQVVRTDSDALIPTMIISAVPSANPAAANLLEIGTTTAPARFTVNAAGNTATTGTLSVGGNATFSTLTGAPGTSMGVNDRIVVADGSGRLSQVSPATFVSATGWSLLGNSLAPTSGAFGQTPVGSFLGTTNESDLRLVTNGKVRVIITETGEFQSNNAVLTGGSIDGMPVGATTRATGAFTTLAATTTITAGTSVTTPALNSNGDLSIAATDGAINMATVGPNPSGITLASGGNNPIILAVDGKERMRLTGGAFGPIGIGTSTPAENSMLQINTAQDSTAGLIVVGTASSLGDLLSIRAADDPVLTARRTGVTVTNLVGTTALTINGNTLASGNLRVTGTTTLGSTLAVTGATTLTGALAANGGVNTNTLVASTSVTTPSVTSSGALALSATGANAITLATNGSVGVTLTSAGVLQADNVAIAGGSINGTAIGNSSRASGAFTTLAANSAVSAPGIVSGGGLALTASSGAVSVTAGGANAIVFNTNGLERARIDSAGFVGIGTSSPEAQLQINTSADSDAGLAIIGTAGAGNLLTVRAGGSPVLTVGRTASTLSTPLTISGTTNVPTLNASGTVTFSALGGGSPNATMSGNDRVVVANSSGRLSNVSVAGLVAAGAWGLSGNTGISDSNYLGTTDDNALRLATNGAVRATLTSTGEFQIDRVAIGAGTIDGTAIGATTASSGRFTTLAASTSVTTPRLTNAGALDINTTAGNIAFNAGGLNSVTLATNGSERLRITEAGLVGVGTGAAIGAQMQVNARSTLRPAFIARGAFDQPVGVSVFEVQSLDSDGAVRKDLTVDPQGLMTLRTLGGATNPNVIVGDRIVVSNSAGELLQVDTVKLITATTWGLTGNDTITQPGTLGETATGDFLGTTVARDLGLVTNGKIGAMLDSGGIFRTAADLVAAGVSVGRGREPNRLGNTAVGTNSLINNNGGDNNTAYGASALRRATLGGQNTAVGVDALSAIRTGSGNVALGYLAGSTAAIDTADRLFIANSATNNLIYGDFANGRLLINAGATPPVTLGAAALQVNSASAGDVGLVVRGAGGQTANLIEARNNGGTVVASVSNGGDAALAGTLGVIGATTLTGALTANGGISTTTLGTSGAATIGNGLTVTTGTTALGGNATVAGTLGVTGATTLGGATQINNTLAVTGATTLTSLGGAVNSTLGSNDRIVVTKSDGLLSNVSVAGLVAAGAWGLSGNTNVAAGNYLGTTDANDLRLATNGTVRATLTSGGQFQIGNVAISGGTINGTSVGATTASTGRFTTLDATSLATTGAATIGNGLTVTTGGLTVSGGATSLAGTLGVTGLLTATGGVSTPTLAATTSVTTPSVTNAGTLALAATGANAITLATNGVVGATLTSAGVLQAGNVAIGGGTINGTSVGATTASTGRFTTLDATSLATTGDGTVRGALSVTGATTLTGLLEAKSGVTTTSITTSRNGTIGGTLTVTGITTLGTVSTGALTAGALTASTLTTTGNATIGGTLTATGGIEGTAINDTVIGNIKPLAATFTTLAGDTGSFDSVAGDELSGSIKVTTPLVTSSTSLALATATSALQLAAAGGSDYVTVTTSNLERLRVAANGNVGIGTDAPGKQLDVAGTFRATGDSVIGAKLDVTGATTLASTLNVNGVTTLAGMLNANGGVTTGAVTATAVSTGTLTATTSLTSPLLSSTGALSLAATGTNDVTISTGGVVRVRIGSDGQVSIGSVDIDGSFRARGASTFDGLLTAGGGIKTSSVGSDASLALTAKDGITASVDGTERLRIDVNGVRIVSGAAGQVGLIVRGASGQTANLLEVQDGAGAAQVIVDETGAMSIGTGAKAATGFKLDVNGNVKVAGDVAANTFTQTSDARFKTNVRAIADALSVVRKLQGVTFDWNRAAFPDRGFSDRPQIGVIAQEVEKVLPELVATDAQGYKSVNYVGFVPVLIEGMKQQADRLDQQAQRLDEQDQRLGAAEKTLAVVEDRLFNTEQQVIKIDERLGKAETFIARFELTRDPDTMVVLTPTFKVQNLTADRAYIAELRAERIEAEKARFKELDADGAVIDSVDAARVRGRVVNTGGKELFVSYGTVTPLFDVSTDGHYFVSVTSEDGSFATAQVINAGGVVRVVPSASQGIDVVANGTSVGLVAPSKKVKASWTRTG